MSAFVCGLDAHKDSTYATIIDCDSGVVSQRRIVNERVLSYLSDYQNDRIGMEASNQVAPLYRQLTRIGRRTRHCKSKIAVVLPHVFLKFGVGFQLKKSKTKDVVRAP